MNSDVLSSDVLSLREARSRRSNPGRRGPIPVRDCFAALAMLGGRPPDGIGCAKAGFE
jgi:hypothetical protein